MPKCPRNSRKKSKTRCFNDNDVVVYRTPGRCPRGSRKTSTNRCFDDNDNEIMFTPSASPPISSESPIPNRGNLALQANHASPIPNRGNLALQANHASIHTIPPYMLNHIQRFVGPEMTCEHGYMRPQTFAMLNQKVPSIGRLMFNFLYPNGEPRIQKNTMRHLRNHVENTTYHNKLFDLFKDYVRQFYITNNLKPIPLTPHEEEVYRYKLYHLVSYLFKNGIPKNPEHVLRYLEDKTGNNFRAPKMITRYE